MNHTFTFAFLLAATLLAGAQPARYITVTAKSPFNGGPGSNTVAIAEGEIGELITFHFTELAYVKVAKGDTVMNAVPAVAAYAGGEASGLGTIVQGPAAFLLQAVTNAGNQAMMTVKITPEVYDVNKTLILPPGTNLVYVGLESSTNLAHWVDATNGVYGSPDTARFFRIKLASP